jgi:hypothetical protein
VAGCMARSSNGDLLSMRKTEPDWLRKSEKTGAAACRQRRGEAGPVRVLLGGGHAPAASRGRIDARQPRALAMAPSHLTHSGPGQLDTPGCRVGDYLERACGQPDQQVAEAAAKWRTSSGRRGSEPAPWPPLKGRVAGRAEQTEAQQPCEATVAGAELPGRRAATDRPRSPGSHGGGVTCWSCRGFAATVCGTACQPRLSPGHDLPFALHPTYPGKPWPLWPEVSTRVSAS